MTSDVLVSTPRATSVRRDAERAALGRVRFGTAVAAITAGSLVLRLAWVVANRGRRPATDAYYYILNADFIWHGEGMYAWPGSGPSAFHPPAWPAVLSVVPALGFSSPFAHQVFGCFVGAVTVFLVALAGREIASARVGILAAALAAVYPNIWIWERQIACETLVMPLMAAVILLSYRFLAKGRVVTIAALGALGAILALTRGEQALLLVLLVVPLVWSRARTDLWRAAKLLTAAAVAAAIVFAPWFVYNATRFDRRVLISTNFGPALRLSNNDYAYYGSGIGAHDRSMWTQPVPVPGRDESVQDEAATRIGLDYARDHIERLPLVIAAREGRTWGFFAVAQQARIDQSWGKDALWVFWAGIVSFWLLAPIAVAGGVALHRRRQYVFPLVVPFVIVALGAAATFGQPRYRAGAEVALVLLAAVGIDAAVRRVRHRSVAR